MSCCQICHRQFITLVSAYKNCLFGILSREQFSVDSIRWLFYFAMCINSCVIVISHCICMCILCLLTKSIIITSILDLLAAGTKFTRPACHATAAAIDRYLLPALDLSSKPAGRRCCCRTGQTDRRTDGHTLNRFMTLTAYYEDRTMIKHRCNKNVYNVLPNIFNKRVCYFCQRLLF